MNYYTISLKSLFELIKCKQLTYSIYTILISLIAIKFNFYEFVFYWKCIVNSDCNSQQVLKKN